MTDLFSVEEWRPCPFHPLLSASSHGRIRVLAHEGDMPHGGTRVYEGDPVFGTIAASTGGFRFTCRLLGRTWRVARVVCAAFHGLPEGERDRALHVNENALDNRAVNLRWATQQECTSKPGFISFHQGLSIPPLVKLREWLGEAA